MAEQACCDRSDGRATRLEWYKRYPRDFREGTRRMTFEERGFYNDVLDLIYEHGNRLLDDDVANAHQLHADLRLFRRLKARLIELGKLYLGDGCLRNGRADAVAVAAANRIAMARGSAQLGGLASRKSKAKSNDFNGSGEATAQAPGAADGEQILDRRQEEDSESDLGGLESVTREEGPPLENKTATPIELRFVERCQINGANPATVRTSIAAWREAIPPGKVVAIMDAATDKRDPYRYAGCAVSRAITEQDAARHAATWVEPDPFAQVMANIQRREKESNNGHEPATDSLMLGHAPSSWH